MSLFSEHQQNSERPNRPQSMTTEVIKTPTPNFSTPYQQTYLHRWNFVKSQTILITVRIGDNDLARFLGGLILASVVAVVKLLFMIIVPISQSVNMFQPLNVLLRWLSASNSEQEIYYEGGTVGKEWCDGIWDCWVRSLGVLTSRIACACYWNVCRWFAIVATQQIANILWFFSVMWL